MQTFKEYYRARYSHPMYNGVPYTEHLTDLPRIFQEYVDEVLVPQMINLDFAATPRKYEPELCDTTYTLAVDPAKYGDQPHRVTLTTQEGNSYQWRLTHHEVYGFVQELAGMINNRRTKGAVCSALIVNGYGVGGGIIDHLRSIGYNPIEVNFAKGG